MSRYIDADEVLNKLNSDNSLKHARSLIKSVVLEQPTAEVQPIVYGEWVCENAYHLPKCSVCGKRSHSGEWHGENSYCGHCGAKMEVQNV